jgi:peptide deformylase
MIITNEHLLRLSCSDVLDSEVSELIDKLQTELSFANKLGAQGVGLAAPQIGIAKKIAIVRIGDFSVNLINAKIEKGYDLAKICGEGCLSFPGKSIDTNRYQEVYVVNNLQYPHSFIATGFTAVVCQHELDHLNSILFIDRQIVKQIKKQKPNDICLCGSGRKYKRCCGGLI